MTQQASGLFITEAEYARRYGVSRASVVGCVARNEIPGVVRAGRAVRIFWPAVVLAGLGTTPAALAKELGCKDLDSLIAFLGGETGCVADGKTARRP